MKRMKLVFLFILVTGVVLFSSSNTIGFVFDPPPTQDTISPTVSITSPASGSVVSGSVTLRASASDNVKVSHVIFQIDGQTLGSDYSPAYTQSLNTFLYSNGRHTVKAIAIDTSGNYASTSRTIYIDNPIITGELYAKGKFQNRFRTALGAECIETVTIEVSTSYTWDSIQQRYYYSNYAWTVWLEDEETGFAFAFRVEPEHYFLQIGYTDNLGAGSQWPQDEISRSGLLTNTYRNDNHYLYIRVDTQLHLGWIDGMFVSAGDYLCTYVLKMAGSTASDWEYIQYAPVSALTGNVVSGVTRLPFEWIDYSV